MAASSLIFSQFIQTNFLLWPKLTQKSREGNICYRIPVSYVETNPLHSWQAHLGPWIYLFYFIFHGSVYYLASLCHQNSNQGLWRCFRFPGISVKQEPLATIQKSLSISLPPVNVWVKGHRSVWKRTEGILLHLLYTPAIEIQGLFVLGILFQSMESGLENRPKSGNVARYCSF